MKTLYFDDQRWFFPLQLSASACVLYHVSITQLERLDVRLSVDPLIQQMCMMWGWDIPDTVLVVEYEADAWSVYLHQNVSIGHSIILFSHHLYLLP